MNINDYLCLLPALIGTSLVVQHPNWFGNVPQDSRISAIQTA